MSHIAYGPFNETFGGGSVSNSSGAPWVLIQKHGLPKSCQYRRRGVDPEVPYRQPFWKKSAGFCKIVLILESMLNFRIGSVSSIGGLIAATLFAATVSDAQRKHNSGGNFCGILGAIGRQPLLETPLKISPKIRDRDSKNSGNFGSVTFLTFRCCFASPSVRNPHDHL